MIDSMFQTIAGEIGVKASQIKAAVELLDAGNTVPFIARYRKEATGELKDEQLRTIEERVAYLRNLNARREDIIQAISEQGKLSETLREALEKADKLQTLEDLYLPYRPKKRTRASMARERGLEPLAEQIKAQVEQNGDLLQIAGTYCNEEVPTAEAALQGALDIIAEEISDQADIRAYLREAIWQDGQITTAFTDDETDRDTYLQYGEHIEPIKQIPSHRILAVNRGEKVGALKVSLQVPESKYLLHIEAKLVKGPSLYKEALQAAVADSFKRLLFPAMEREIRNTLTEKAEEQAIQIFAMNLKNLLLLAPLAGHVIMGLDPGYRTGCKMAIIDAQGNVLDYGAYHLTMSEEAAGRAQKALAGKIRKYGVTLLSIGNGTASYETEQFVSKMIEEEKLDCHYVITNEAGASVYSASKLAVEELPDLDVTIRGAVSIARRVQDPLAESVKIDPKSIGVGQYQHDVNQKRLTQSLDQVVEQVVNYVGVELNTASAAILQHVAGISATVAKNIHQYRQEHGPFKSRKELLKVARLGPAAFTQCAGFLRIAESEQTLDRTSVHPESYGVAERMIAELGFSLKELQDKERLRGFQALLATVDSAVLARKVEAGEPTVRDILDALAKPGRDPREDLPAPMTRKKVVSLAELPVGTIVKGTVHNVVDFGAFLDIGLKVNGLLHRSEFCLPHEHPSDVVAVGNVLEVEIISIDEKRNRIGLSMKTQREARRKELAKKRKEQAAWSRKKKGMRGEKSKASMQNNSYFASKKNR